MLVFCLAKCEEMYIFVGQKRKNTEKNKNKYAI